MRVQWIGIPIVAALVVCGTVAHARHKVRLIAPKNAGIRLDNVSLGWHEWLRLDFKINEGSERSPAWRGAYHWSIRDNNAWWGCSVD